MKNKKCPNFGDWHLASWFLWKFMLKLIFVWVYVLLSWLWREFMLFTLILEGVFLVQVDFGVSLSCPSWFWSEFMLSKMILEWVYVVRVVFVGVCIVRVDFDRSLCCLWVYLCRSLCCPSWFWGELMLSELLFFCCCFNYLIILCVLYLDSLFTNKYLDTNVCFIHLDTNVCFIYLDTNVCFI
jgi:hypothetical protein